MRNKVFFLALAVLCLTITLANAQQTTGTISGTVADNTGAVLPGAKVEITNEGTGAVRDVVTDARGYYEAPLLPVGNYKVSTSLEGFQTEVRTGITMAVGQHAVLDMKLQVGQVSQSVEVTGEAPLVQTAEATVSYLASDQTIRDLPLNDRDLSQLILLQPGVNDSETSGAQAYNGYGRRISISGARGEDNLYMMDGGLIGDYRRHIPAGPSGALLGTESVQEFQVLTTDIPAQYGRALGGVFNAVSKSGTNNFHGDLYEFIRNSDLDANKWEANAFSLGVKAPFKRNQFGGTLGGPVKKDKVFFFVGYEGTRERLGINETTKVFDNNARLGIFPAAQGGSVPTISPLTQPYLNWYPFATPGATNFGNGTQNYLTTFTQPTAEDYGQARVDFPTLTDKDSLFVRFTGSDASRSYFEGLPIGSLQISSLGAALSTISYTHIFSPTLLNTIRFHFNRVVPLDTGSEPPPPSNIFLTPGQNVSPNINPGTVAGIGGGGFLTNPTEMASNRFTYQDDVNLTKGAHSITFGGQLERFQLNDIKYGRQMGIWTWSSPQAFLSGTCQALTGGIASGSLASSTAVPSQCAGAGPNTTDEISYRGAPPGIGIFRRGWRTWDFGFYVQDNWRVSKKLSINAGLRYEPYTVPTEVNNLIANMTNIFSPNLGQSTTPCSAIVWPVVGAAGCSQTPLPGYWINRSWKNFSPRFGIAYDPFGNGKTSIRAGFGLLYIPNDPDEYYNAMDRMPPLAYDFQIPSTGFFPFASQELGAQSSLGPAYAVDYGHNVSPHMLQYSFTIQQELTSNDLLQVGYTGSRGLDQVGFQFLNIPFATYNGTSLEFPVGAVQPNPNFSNINFFGPWGDSYYNSLQFSFQRRFSKGLQTGVSFTWSKTMSTSDQSQISNIVNGGSPDGLYDWDNRAERGLSGYDIARQLRVNYSYDIPTFGSMKSGIVGKILSGWQLTGVLTAHSGHPTTISTGIPSGLSVYGTDTRYPLLNPAFTGSVVVGTPSQGFNSTTTTLSSSQYLNPNAFIFVNCPTADVGLGGSTLPANCEGVRELGNSGKNNIIGPGLFQWDPALLKTFNLTERTKMQFRAECFNVTNTPNYSGPAVSLANANGILSTSFGQITSTNGASRQMQFAVKLLF